ncbi:MmyB family transcriptional regulator, partial [Streptomyces sp. 7R007]
GHQVCSPRPRGWSRSPECDRWWQTHRVHQRAHGSKRLHHPVVGDLTVEYETLTLPGDPDTTLFVYTAEEGSSSKRSLDLLASWTLTSPADASPEHEHR